MFAVIFIPNFSLQAVLRHEPESRERAVALVDPKLPKPIIVQLTSTARSCGVCEGLTPSQAMARCSELIIKSRSPAQEESATEVLLQTAYAFSPNIESTAPGVCTMELKGLTFHSNGEAAEEWAEKMVEVLAQFYVEAKVGLAATPELALLAARAADPVLALGSEFKAALTPALSHPMGEEEGAPAFLAESNRGIHAATVPDLVGTPRCGVPVRVQRTESCGQNGLFTLAPLNAARTAQRAVPTKIMAITLFRAKPAGQVRAVESFHISTLEPPPEILEILQRWGIRTIGALLALGRDNIAERLGPAAAELFNRVSPDSPRPLKLAAPAEEFGEQMEFENEIETAEPLLFVLRRFVEQLSRRLELIYLVIAEFHLQLGLSSGAKYERVFKIPAPTGNIEILFRMLQTHLETVRTDSPITSLRLAAKHAKPEARQFGLFESTLRDPNQFAETLARLTALCGPDQVGTPEVESTHRPDAFKVAPTFLSAGSGTHRNTGLESPVNPQAGKPALPLRRFRPPLPSHIEFRGEKPALLRSHVFNGPIVELRGPFCSSGNWWDIGRWAREEWDIETSDGSLFRIFRSSDGCFVEGVYD